MSVIISILQESYFLLNKMSVYLILGFVFAGILHVFIKPSTISKHLGENNLFSVIKASLFGIPLPLCSCGVIPATISLKKDGASRASILSFLISTPTTGIDSIFATYALLGPFFAIYRVLASLVSAIFTGLMATVFLPIKSRKLKNKVSENCPKCLGNHKASVPCRLREKIKSIFTYSFGTLLRDSGVWILLGILIGGLISFFAPESMITKYLGSPLLSMLVMLIVGIPMYICSAGSIPIALALLTKGMSPAAAFVFLLAGPATNSITLTVLAKELGKKTVAVFLSAIIACSLGLGLLMQYIINLLNIDISRQLMLKHAAIPKEVEVSASLILLILIIYGLIKSKIAKK